MIYYGTKDGEMYGFYLDTKGFINDKYIELTEENHRKIIEDANSQGKIIKPDEKGNPVLMDPPEPTEKELKERRILELQNYLTTTDWYAIRFADTGEEIPAIIKQKRQSARDEISALRN